MLNDKVLVVASDATLGQEVTEKISLAKDKVKAAAPYPGADFSRGRRRAHPGTTKKKRARLRKASQRLAESPRLKSTGKTEQ